MGARDREALRGWRRASLAKRSDRRAAIAGAVATGETLVYALQDLPEPVQRYFRYSGVAGKPIVRSGDECFDVTITDLHFDVWPDTVRPAAPLERSA